MNKLFATALIAVASLGTSLSAVAQEATLFDTGVISAQTRAEVRAEVLKAVANGQNLGFGEARV